MDLKNISLPPQKEKTKGELLKDSFRNFLNNKWYEHCEELMAWEKQYPQYDREYYFKKHKWLLKRMYKEHMAVEKYAVENEKEISKLVKRGFKKGRKSNF